MGEEEEEEEEEWQQSQNHVSMMMPENGMYPAQHNGYYAGGYHMGWQGYNHQMIGMQGSQAPLATPGQPNHPIMYGHTNAMMQHPSYMQYMMYPQQQSYSKPY